MPSPPGGAVPDVTRPTGTTGGRPTGRPTSISPQIKDDVRRSLERENDTANILAADGYQVHQNPNPKQVAEARRTSGDQGKPESNPDYLVEGRVFDCYAPSTRKPVRGIWTEVASKVEKEQTQRVVVNLQDWGGDPMALRKQFADWPIPNLREVKGVARDGTIVTVWHRGKDT